jgi:hypothetical protein
MKLHRISAVDENHPGFWMLDEYAIMIAPLSDSEDKWQVCLHGLASKELRIWFSQELPQNHFSTFSEAKKSLAQKLKTVPEGCRLALPELRKLKAGHYLFPSGVKVTHERSWQLTALVELPFWARTAQTLFEAKLLAKFLGEQIAPPVIA